MTNILETHNLGLGIAHKVFCSGLSLHIEKGDMWGILGANGSGKTTLLQTLAGLRSAQSGQILLHKKPVQRYSRKVLARYLGILLQDTQDVFSQTVFEFCLAGRYPYTSYFGWNSHVDHEIVKSSLNLMDLINKEQEEVKVLSGGERRRLDIATLLVQSPALYLLDEPTNHLDLHYQMKVLNHFKNQVEKKDNAVMMSAHDVNLVQRYCNKVLMLLDGGEALHGQVDNILTIENLSRLYQHPFQSTVFHGTPVWLPCFDT